MSQYRETGETPQREAIPEPQAAPPAPPAPTTAPVGPAGMWPPVSPGPGAIPSPGMAPWLGGNGGAPAGAPPRSRKHLVFGAAGLGIGLILGFGLGQINIPFSSNAIETAAEACDVMDTFGIEIGDNGQSISMSSEGDDSAGAEYADITCVLAELEIPDSVETRIGTTRALDGRQSADWKEFTASWGYHPDSGLNIVIESAEN